ncbi:MAG: helicase C-terminal domain-containing protein [Conexivisphaerales archaeon]
MLNELGDGKRILLSSYVGSGKTSPVIFSSINSYSNDVVISVFKHNNYIPIINEINSISLSSNVSIDYAGIFGKEYMQDLDKPYFKRYFNPFEDSYYRTALRLIRYSKIKIINARHILDPDLLIRALKRFNIIPKESTLILDEAHNLLEEVISRPKIIYNIRYIASAFKRSIFLSGTFIPKDFFLWLLLPDKYIEIKDSRRIKIFVSKNINMSFVERPKNLERVCRFLNEISREKDVVAFFQNNSLKDYFRNKLSSRVTTEVFKGRLHESISLEGKTIVAVGMPFPHLNVLENIREIALCSGVRFNELLYGITASRIIQMIGRAARHSYSSPEIFILDNRALKGEFTKFLPKSYELSSF